MDYIEISPIYEICNWEEQTQGYIRLLKCWYQVITWEEEGDGTSEAAEMEVG